MEGQQEMGVLTLLRDGFNSFTYLAFPTISHQMPSSHKDSVSSSSSPVSNTWQQRSSCRSACNSSSLSDPGPDSLAHRCLTRQKKLRYVTDHDLGIAHLNDRPSKSSPASPARKSSSPGGSDRHWSFSAVPQPLPLPESPFARRPDSSTAAAAEGSSPPPFVRKSTDHTAKNYAKTSSSKLCPMRLSQDSNVGTLRDSFLGPNLVASAKRNGVLCSPVSPRRSNAGGILFSHVACDNNNNNSPNYFNYYHSQDPIKEVDEAFNLRVNIPSKSAPVSPRRSQNIHSGRSITESPVRNPHSADHSPLHSPVTGNIQNNPRSRKGISFPSLSAETSAERPESNNNVSHVNAHPLPLPPGATITSQPVTTVHHNADMKGQWQKGKLIGRGTFGSVYLAMNRETGALCAMKEVDLIPDDPKSAECIKQLEQEIKVLRQLNHPNIVQYYGSEIIDDHFYIYLEYVYPGSINKYVREHCGAITESVVRNFTRHILSGLAYLHSTKTIHRDIKGANLLVDASGVVKLADFGMAKHLTGLSYDLSLKGSPYWMAPEVIKAVMQNNTNPNLALAVDIWSLGCTIIEMLNGKPPWSDFTGPQAMFKVLNRTPEIPETLSSEGKEFLNLCFRRNPAERPSAAMLLEHAFVQNSQYQNVSAVKHNFSAMNIMDKLNGQRDRGKHNIDFMSISSRVRTGTTSGNLPYGNASSSWTLTL